MTGSNFDLYHPLINMTVAKTLNNSSISFCPSIESLKQVFKNSMVHFVVLMMENDEKQH